MPDRSPRPFSPRPRRVSAALLVLVLLLVGSPAGGAPPKTAETGSAGTSEPSEPSEIVLRPAARPSRIDLARYERWKRVWEDEAGSFDRAFEAALRAAAGTDRDLVAHCSPLAAAILAVDRRRVLPAPDRAADLCLRRALHAAALAAVACLGDRPYAARGKLREARDELACTARRLRRFRRAVEPAPEP